MSNKLLIEVSNVDHAYVESVCSNGTFSFSSFFSHVLELYKKSLNESTECFIEKEEEEPVQKSKVKKK